MKFPLASTTAAIRDQNFLQEWMTTSLSMSAITSEIWALREARVFTDLSLNYAPHEII
jgi:urease accessory protein UreF